MFNCVSLLIDLMFFLENRKYKENAHFPRLVIDYSMMMEECSILEYISNISKCARTPAIRFILTDTHIFLLFFFFFFSVVHFTNPANTHTHAHNPYAHTYTNYIGFVVWLKFFYLFLSFTRLSKLILCLRTERETLVISDNKAGQVAMHATLKLEQFTLLARTLRDCQIMWPAHWTNLKFWKRKQQTLGLFEFVRVIIFQQK